MTTEKQPSGFSEFSPRPVASTGAPANSFTPYSPEWFARTRGAFLQPGDAEPRTDDFVAMHNPSSLTVKALVFLGLPPRSPPPPNDGDDDQDKPSPARRAWAAERTRSLDTLIVMAPGETLLVPRSLVSCLVQTNPEGTIVVGGLAPHLRLVSDPNPPSMHPGLLESQGDDSPFAVPGPT